MKTASQCLWVGALVLVLGVPVVAEATNVKLGMTATKARATLSAASDLPVSGIPNYSMLFSASEQTTVGLCRGTVVWIAEDLGKTLSDFVYQVHELKARLGEPRYTTFQARSSGGEQTYVTATWATSTGSVSVRHGLTYWAGEDVSLITSAFSDGEAALRCK